MPSDFSTRNIPTTVWPETHPSWQCTKCGAVFSHMNFARLHLRVKHKFRLFTARAERIERCIVPSTRVAPLSAYKHSAGVVAGRAYAVGRLQDEVAVRSYQALEALDDSEVALSSSLTVAFLIRAARHRRPIITLASTLDGRDREFTLALARDEEDIMNAVVSMSEADKAELSRLTGQVAADLLDLLDMVLHPASPSDSDGLPFKGSSSQRDTDLERSLQRVFVRLCESSLQLPHRLWLSQVRLSERQPVDGGSYGEIYKGIYAGKTVALKSLRVLRHREDNAKNQKAFFREVALVRGIDHRHVCTIIGVDRNSLSGLTCVVLPWMDYGNVLQYLAKVGWSLEDAVRLIYQVASGLAYLHDMGVVHGDLHIGNILVDADRDIHLADFGLANFSDATMSCSSAQPGATRCMAPEIFDPIRFRLPRVQHTPASDVYSFGQVSWQIYTGKIPFPDLGNYQAMFAILDGKRQNRSLSERRIPDALWDILQECWHFEPKARIDTVTLRQRMENLDAYGIERATKHEESPEQNVDSGLSLIPRGLPAEDGSMSELHLDRDEPPLTQSVTLRSPQPRDTPISDSMHVAELPDGADILNDQVNLITDGAKAVALGESQTPQLALAMARSTEVWLQDLRIMCDQAKDFFPDIVWVHGIEDDIGGSTEVWGHSAIVSSRASTSFHKAYFSSVSPSTPAYPARIPTSDVQGLQPELRFLYTAETTGTGQNVLADGQAQLSKLREQLTSMWQLGLKSDVLLVVSIPQTQKPGAITDVTLHAHRFVLAARSPYFLDQFRSSLESNGAVTLRLPSPPFSSASLQLIIEWIYAGALDLPERPLNLGSALNLLRGAAYLHINALYDEAQAYIVEEMMHGLFHAYEPSDEYEALTGGAWPAGGCTCRRCARRAPRLLEFVRKYEPTNKIFERGARRALVAHFGEGWCSEDFAALPQATRGAALSGLAKYTVPLNVFALLYASQAGMKRLGEVKGPWVAVCREMLLAAADKIDQVLCAQAKECFRQNEWLEIVEAYEDNVEQDQKLEWILDSIQRGMGDESAAVLYEILKQTELTYPDTNPYVRRHVERAYQEIGHWIRSRWRQVWEAGGFKGVEPWAISQILRGINSDDEHLLKILNDPYAISRGLVH